MNFTRVPTVTVGIPAYNEERNIREILEGILAQEEDGFRIEKIIVASDGSTDKTADIVRSFRDPRIQLIAGRENRGQNYRQNQIIDHTNSDILVLFNADIIIGDGCAVYSRIRNGDNIYTCIGAMRALSRPFYRTIQFPEYSEGEDQYLYLTCIAKGLVYRSTDFVNAFFKLPCSYEEYTNRRNRLFHIQHNYIHILSDARYRYERRIPLNALIHGFAYALSQFPLSTLLYVLFEAVMRVQDILQSAIDAGSRIRRSLRSIRTASLHYRPRYARFGL